MCCFASQAKRIAVLLSVLLVSVTASSQSITSATLPNIPSGRLPMLSDVRHLPRAKVSKIVDGGTVILSAQGQEITCRFIGVDAVDAPGKTASQFLTQNLSGETVWFAVEGSNPINGQGQLLVHIFKPPDGQYVNLEIIKQGYGHADAKYPFSFIKDFQYYERLAKETYKGSWAGLVNPSLDSANAPSTFQAQSFIRNVPKTKPTPRTTVYYIYSAPTYPRYPIVLSNSSNSALLTYDHFARGHYGHTGSRGGHDHRGRNGHRDHGRNH
jgi:endonuclease YncB( thermonuclease family)